MSTTYTDEIGETVDGLVRLAITGAALAGERRAAHRAKLARLAEAQSLQEARENAERVEAIRAADLAALAQVEQARWWDSATPEQIKNMYTTATSWPDDERFVKAKKRMEQELDARWGITGDQVDRLAHTPPGEDAQAQHRERDAQRDKRAAQDLMDKADERDQQGPEEDARRSWREDLRGRNDIDPQAKDAFLAADKSQPAPVAGASNTGKIKARKYRSPLRKRARRSPQMEK